MNILTNEYCIKAIKHFIVLRYKSGIFIRLAISNNRRERERVGDRG